MRARLPPSRFTAAAIAVLAGACGRIGYEGDFRREELAGNAGSDVAAAGSGGTFDPPGSTGAGGGVIPGAGAGGSESAPDAALPAVGGAAGSGDVTGDSGTTGAA